MRTRFVAIILISLISIAATAATPEQCMVPLTSKEAASSKSYSLPGLFWGAIGGYEAYMEVRNGRGTVQLIGSGNRIVRVKSYSGGVLILNAYSTSNRYLGYYKGKVTYERAWNRTFYTGRFYNVNGASVEFTLHNNLD